MPTDRPRHVITETDEITAALDEANRAWPEAGGNKNALIKLLLQAGRESLQRNREAVRAERLQRLESALGSLTGVYRPNELEELRKDWPE